MCTPAGGVTATTIREAEPADGPALCAIHLSAWRAAYRGVIADTLLDGSWIETGAQRWRRWLDGTPERSARVACHGDRPLGFCATVTPSPDYDEDDSVARILALNVRADAWRAGIGTALMTRTLASFRRDGWRTASLWVFERNHGARAFYAHLGFEPDGTVDTFAGAGVVRLRQPLGALAPA